MILWLPSTPLLLLAVWDGVDGQEGQGEREIPEQVKRQSHEIKRGLSNLLVSKDRYCTCKFEGSKVMLFIKNIDKGLSD
jgi:hypothetical protein